MSEAEGSETKVFSTKNKNKAVDLRSKLLNEFPGHWYFIFNLPNKSHEIRIANAWGGKLSSDEIKKIKEFIKVNKNKKEKEDEREVSALN